MGSNYAPSTAINQLEMWQADTFDPRTIDRELGWAQAIGLNTMRVFLQDLAYKGTTPPSPKSGSTTSFAPMAGRTTLARWS